jgi:hypothetical protein
VNTVYALRDPSTFEIRYIGVTKKRLGHRLSQHVWAAKNGAQSYVAHWIGTLDTRPLIEALEDGCRRDREVFWIKHYRALGARLTNLTDGGEGVPGLQLTEEHRKKIGDGNRDKVVLPEVRRRIGASLRGRKKTFSAKHRRNIGLAQLGKKRGPQSEQHRARIATALRGNANGKFGRKGKPGPK